MKNYLKNNRKIKLDDSKNLLKDIFALPYKFKNDNSLIDTIFNKYGKDFEEFKNYFQKQWNKFFINGTLDYTSIDKKYRSNSYIENYNKGIKLKLSSYLFGKSKTKISWPLFNYFIVHEEDDYRNEIIDNESKLTIKIENNIIINDFGFYHGKFEDIEEDNLNNINRKWLKYNNYSCRYDAFLFIYVFIIREEILKINNNDINSILNIFNLISEDIIKASVEVLNEGIWKIIDNYKINYPFLNEYYKNEYTINQLFYLLNNNEIFCIKYLSVEGCNKCLITNKDIKFLSSIINFDDKYIDNFSIQDLIYFNLKNDVYVCPKCGYLNDKIIDINIKNYYKIVNNISLPNFIFIGFEFCKPEDAYYINGKPKPINLINSLIWDKINSKIETILNILVDEFIVYNIKYSLKGIICSPFSGHYSGLLYKLQNNLFLLEKGFNFYYDDYTNNNEIIKINENYKGVLRNNLPFIIIYKKNI